MKKIYAILVSIALLSVISIKSQAQAYMTVVQTIPGTTTTVTGPISTTVQAIQSISGADLSNCTDLSYYDGKVVSFRGRMPVSGRTNFPAATIGGVAYPAIYTTTGVNKWGREQYITAGTGPFSSVMVRQLITTTAVGINPNDGDDLLNATAGDSVYFIGKVNNFNGMTQVEPYMFSILGSAFEMNPSITLPTTIDGQQIEGVFPVTVTVAELNTGSGQINNMISGEKYEAMFVELRDVTVVDIFPASYNLLSTGDRVRITVADDFDNRIQIYDRYKAARLPANISIDNGPTVSVGGRLDTSLIPTIGGKYTYIKGMLIHSKNAVPGQDCAGKQLAATTGGTAPQDQGYQLHPFYSTHYGKANYNIPKISDVNVVPISPKPSESVTISATIQAIDPGVTISRALLYYSSDTINFTSWNNITMTGVGQTWSGTIPNFGFTEGKIIYYYIKAIDSRTPTAAANTYPKVLINGNPGKDKPAAFVVREGGLQIYDIQKTPFSNGRSLYENRQVTVTGVATSTVKDLGVVTIQQENVTEWGAVMLENTNNFLVNVKKGDKISVAGTVMEQGSGASFGNSSAFTTLKNLTLSANVVPLATGIKIQPLDIDHILFSGNYDYKKHEKYEALFIRISAFGKLFVADTNADYSNNFSEYRIGTDTTTLLTLPANSTGTGRNLAVVGTRVLTGRTPFFSPFITGSTVISSQSFPLITNPVTVVGSTSNFLPDTANIKANHVNTIYATRKVSFDNISGIAQHSFGAMKLLPRDVFDIKGLKIGGVDAALTLPGFGTVTAIESATGTLTDIILFPNPTEGDLHIKTSGNAVFSLSVYNVIGAIVSKQASFTGESTISLGGLPKGTYLIKIANLSEGSFTYRRVILQ